MSILNWFIRTENKISSTSEKLNIPGDLWVKCFSCNSILYLKELEANLKVCLECNYHFRLSLQERINYMLDTNSLEEINADIGPKDFLNFKDSMSYSERIKKAQKKTGNKDAVITGTAKIKRIPVNVAIMDFSYMGGSMGSVVGEKITLLIEKALKNKFPLIIFSSSGGARMQEGITSLMQMAKTSGALKKLDKEKIPFISVLCDPTTGGTTASFSMLGDIHIAEPGALIGFAGPRVIEQTIRQKLPKGFQRSEFLQNHGMVDMVVDRKDLKDRLAFLVTVLNKGK
ncbi:acetyl-CoA carboxylase, carboxyltransferase subunit beta [Candidatus Margulisiibacteriota bacterium]